MSTETPRTDGHPEAAYRHLAFRPDIEGLRAIAILAVVACHAGVSWLQGGFIGVDVFFVLSGYLITGLLLKELGSTGKIDFLDFYARRLKRLLPGLLTMVVVSSVAASVLLSPYEQVTQALSASSVYFWVSNFFFSLTDLDYFSPQAESFLFLHTWSLAVEEQFYLIWPVFILGLFAVGRAPAHKSPLMVYRRYLTLVFIVSLVLCLYLSYTRPLWGFFMMSARGWQFALGAMLFVMGNAPSSGKSVAAISRPLNVVAGWTGLLLIILCSILYSEDMLYPSYLALLPSVGGALVILSGSSGQSPLAGLLCSKPMQMIGKGSYSWYLWHWPVLLLGRALFPESGAVGLVVMVLLSLILALLTLYTIELPVRQQSGLARRPALVLVASLVLMTTGYFVSAQWQQKAVEWANSPGQLTYQQVRKDLPEIYEMGCDDWINSAVVKICSFGNDNPGKRVLLFGDSIVLQWFPGLAGPLIKEGWQVLVLTKSGCPMVDEPIFYSRIGQEYTVCSQWRDTALEQLEALRPGLIFTGSASDYAYTPEQWEAGTKRIVQRLAGVSDHVFLIPGTYRLPFDGPLCLARQQWQPAFIAGLNRCDWSPPDDQDAQVFKALELAAADHANVSILDLNPFICPDGMCASMIQDSIVYRDYQHVSASYVEQVSDAIRLRIAEIMPSLGQDL